MLPWQKAQQKQQMFWRDSSNIILGINITNITCQSMDVYFEMCSQSCRIIYHFKDSNSYQISIWYKTVKFSAVSTQQKIRNSLFEDDSYKKQWLNFNEGFLKVIIN